MQEEIVDKSLVVVINTVKLTTEVLQDAIHKILEAQRTQKFRKEERQETSPKVC